MLEWLLTTPMAETFAQQLRVELPTVRKRLRDGYGGQALERDGLAQLQVRRVELSRSARAWGLSSSLDCIEAVEDTGARDNDPRFERLEIAFSV